MPDAFVGFGKLVARIGSGAMAVRNGRAAMAVLQSELVVGLLDSFEGFFEFKAAVVGCKCNFHGVSPL